MAENYAAANPKQLEHEGRVIVQASNEGESGLLDRLWTKTAFMVSDSDIGDKDDVVNRYWSSASTTFVDSRIGHNIGINPRPQWTPYCDLRNKGRLTDRPDVTISSTIGGYGVGRAWYENIDVPSQKIYLRMGVPRFNSLTDFMFRAFDRSMTIMARTGRAPSAWYTAAKIAGTAVAFTAAPLLTIAIEAGKVVKFLMANDTSRFFSLKPTMHLYWNMVNSLCLTHAVNTGIIKKVFEDESEKDTQRIGRTYKIDSEQLQSLHEIIPDMIMSNGTFDVFAIATRAQRLANRMFEYEYERLNVSSATNFEGFVKRDNTTNGTHRSWITNGKGEHTLSAFFNNMVEFGTYYKAPNEDMKSGSTENAKTELDPRIDPAGKHDPETGEPPKQNHEGGWIENHIKQMDAEWRDGASFACFRVDYTGSQQESFGSTTGESALQQKINGISNDFREARFSLADGNVVGELIGEIGNKLVDVGMGLLDGVTLGMAGLLPGLAGSGYIDIPKHWQSSSVSLPTGNYTIQLISPYNNSISRMMGIWIPFYMLLALIVPRSTGKQSYTSPFYLQLYDRGRVQSRLAMARSLSITRGTSNLGFDTRGQALALDVNLQIEDLSSIMHMPVSTGGFFETDLTLDDDNITQDYLSVLAGMDIYSQIYTIPRAQRKMTKWLAETKYKITSPAFHVSLFKNIVEDGMINDLTLGVSGGLSNIYSGLARGSGILAQDTVDF